MTVTVAQSGIGFVTVGDDEGRARQAQSGESTSTTRPRNPDRTLGPSTATRIIVALVQVTRSAGPSPTLN